MSLLRPLRQLSAQKITQSFYSTLKTTASSTFDAKQLTEQYNKDGYLILRNVLDSELMEEAKNHVNYLLKKYPSIPPEHLHHHIMRNDAFWVRLISDPRLLDLASVFVGSDVALFSSHYFCKLPKTGMRVLWHQDGSYWPLRPVTVITMWLAIDHSDTQNGCMRIVKGSHTSSLKELKRSMEDKNVLGYSTHENSEIQHSEIVDLILKPGDVSIHHPNIIHGSEPNTSDRRRCGLTIRYIPPTTLCTNEEQPVMIFRGKAVPGINNYRSWPKYRTGFDLPFKGSDKWNEKRYINVNDEKYFKRTDYNVMTQEITTELEKFVDELGGR